MIEVDTHSTSSDRALGLVHLMDEALKLQMRMPGYAVRRPVLEEAKVI